MHKCYRCGKEYEGRFCPDCGTEYVEEKICPDCGAKLGGEVRFCNNCGHAFVAVEKSGKSSSEAGDNAGDTFFTQRRCRTIAGAARYAHAALFALFAVLLFAFYAAPVATIFGEGVGNVYSMTSGILGEIPALKGAMIALIIFAVVTLIFAGFRCAGIFVKEIRYKKIKLFKIELSAEELSEYIGYAFYLIYFIIGCVICGKIGAEDGGAGLIKSGGCPILLIVFSLLFGLISAGIRTGKYILSKKVEAFSSAVAASDENERKKGEKYSAEAKVKKDAKQAERERYLASLPVPVPVPEPAKEVMSSAIYIQAEKTVKSKRLAALWLLDTLLVSALVCTFVVLRAFVHKTWSKVDFVILMCLITVLMVAAFALSTTLTVKRRVKTVKYKKAVKRGLLIFFIVEAIFFIELTLGPAVIFISASSGAGTYEYYAGHVEYAYLIPSVIFCGAMVGFVAHFCSVICAFVSVGKLRVAMYGTKKIKKAQLQVSEAELYPTENMLAEYRLYLKKKKLYQIEKRLYDKELDFTKSEKRNRLAREIEK